MNQKTLRKEEHDNRQTRSIPMETSLSAWDYDLNFQPEEFF
jgi:hypothetical protein